MKTLVYLFLLLLAGLSSCRSIKYVPVESVRHDSIFIGSTQRDSIYHRDSIYIKENGDTVTIFRDRYLYRDRYLKDTVYQSFRDTVTQTYPVEKELSSWQKAQMAIGKIAMIFLVVLVLIFGIRIFKKS